MDTTIQRAILTGATGMIGMALISHLLEQQIEVIALIRENSPHRSQFKQYFSSSSNLITVVASLSDLEHTQDIAKKIELAIRQKGLTYEGKHTAFIHLGWEGTFGESRNNTYLQNLNIRYTLDSVCLAHALSCEVFVGAGSQAEYGRVSEQTKLSPQTPTFPENGYGIAKLAAGQFSRILCEEYKIRHVWGRILSIYGPFDGENTMVMSAIQAIADGKRPYFTKGEQLWDYLYVEDAARALYLLAEQGKAGAVYPIGSGQTRHLHEYIRIIRDIVDRTAPLGIGELPYLPGQVMYLCADIELLMEDTGFSPIVTFEEGIEKTVSWFRTSQKKSIVQTRP